MNQKDLQPFLDVAISVLERKDAIAAKKLKDFLKASPGPTYIEQALGSAVVHFAENNASVFAWILSEQDILSPELELISFTQKLTRQRLVGLGWTEEETFLIKSDKLLVDSKYIDRLDDCFSEGELMLIRVFFQIDVLLSQ